MDLAVAMAPYTSLSLYKIPAWVAERITRTHPQLKTYWSLVAAGGGTCLLGWYNPWQVACSPINDPSLVPTQATLIKLSRS